MYIGYKNSSLSRPFFPLETFYSQTNATCFSDDLIQFYLTVRDIASEVSRWKLFRNVMIQSLVRKVGGAEH